MAKRYASKASHTVGTPRLIVHVLAFEQIVETRPVEPRPGEDEFDAICRRGIADGPATRVKQRHHRADGVPRRTTVSHRAVMSRIHGTRWSGGCRAPPLGVPRGSGGVAQGRGGPLVEFGPLEIVLLAREEPLIAWEGRQPAFGSPPSSAMSTIRQSTGKFEARRSASGMKVVSIKRRRSATWLTMYTIWSSNSRWLIV